MDLDRPFVMDATTLDAGLRTLAQRYDIRTICNVLRRIHLLARNEAVSQLCAEAITMAKHMDARLRWYRQDWDKGLWIPETHPLPPP